jgi:PAS domain S-box-containing protein
MENSSNAEPHSPTIQPAIEERTGSAGQAQAELAAIVTSSDDAILSETLDGIITTWNAGAQRIFGYAAQEIIGQPILRLIPPELHDEEEQILKRIKAGQRIEQYETERLTKDGNRVPVSLTISPLNHASGNIIASKIARDITERKRSEEAIRVLKAQLSADLSAMTRMQQISTRLVQAGDSPNCSLKSSRLARRSRARTWATSSCSKTESWRSHRNGDLRHRFWSSSTV